jgi:hypothetical protein
VAKGKIANEVAYRANIEGRIITFSGWLDTFALFLPTRVANEEIGDALEDIKRRVVRGCPPWHVWAKVVSTIIWASLHAIATVWSPGGGKKGAGQ